MPIETFTHDGTLKGSDLSALVLGSALATQVSVKLHREVALSWDLVPASTDSMIGRDGDKCYDVTTQTFTLIWRATVSETVTKTAQTTAITHKVAEVIGDVGKLVTAGGSAILLYTWWTGGGAAGGAVTTAVGAVVTAAAENVESATAPKVETWTVSYVESGSEAVSVSAYTEIPCEEGADHPTITVPDPAPTLELEKSSAVARVGARVARSGTLHPPG